MVSAPSDTVMEPTPSGAGTLSRRVTGAFSTATGRKLLINLIALGILCVVLTLLNDRFLTPANITNVLRQIAAVVTVGAAITLLMVSGGLDLSIGGVVALSGCTAALLSNQMPLPTAFLIGTVVGGLVGLLNGFLVEIVGINSVIATLGTMYVSRGSALLVTGGVPVYQVPRGYEWIGAGYIGAIPVPVVVMIVTVIVFVLIERRTLLGKYAVAVGSNPQAAYLAGVPIRRTRMTLYILAGLTAGWGGVMISSRLASGIPNAGLGFEFEVIVATVLGGTSLLGGQGTVIGMVIGALIVGTLNNGLNLLGVQSFWQTVALGTVLVLAVGLDAALRREGGRPRLSWKLGRPAAASVLAPAAAPDASDGGAAREETA
jgi:ribose/xylose/arabinose/galactoside ABC-type transport system permease subunit